MRKIFGLLATLLLLASPVLAEDTIKLGAFFDLSGRASFIGTPSKLVAEMLVDKINAEGGIGGKKIELIIADTAVFCQLRCCYLINRSIGMLIRQPSLPDWCCNRTRASFLSFSCFLH